MPLIDKGGHQPLARRTLSASAHLRHLWAEAATAVGSNPVVLEKCRGWQSLLSRGLWRSGS